MRECFGLFIRKDKHPFKRIKAIRERKIYDHSVEFEILLLIEVPKEPRGI